jgi:hypothetical protein
MTAARAPCIQGWKRAHTQLVTNLLPPVCLLFMYWHNSRDQEAHSTCFTPEGRTECDDADGKSYSSGFYSDNAYLCENLDVE